MAKGPFSPVEQAPISDVRLVAEKLPKSAVEAGAGVVKAVGVVAEDLIDRQREDFQKGLEEDLRTGLKPVEEALNVVRDPDSLEDLFTKAAEGDPIFVSAKDELIRIGSAMRRGKVAGDAARIRMRAVLATAINEAPAFADELRASARDILGFGPEQAVVRDLLRDPTAGPKTAVQKELEQIQVDVQVFGIPEEVSIAMRRNARVNASEMAQITLDIKRGDATAASAAHLADLAANAFLTDFSAKMQAKINADGGIEDVAGAKLAANQVLQEMRGIALAAMGPNASTQQRAAFNKTWQSHSQFVNNSVTGGSLLKLYTQHNNTAQAMALADILKIPDLATMHELGGDSGMLALLEVYGNYTTQAQIDAAMLVSPELAGLNTFKRLTGAITTAVFNQQSGREMSTRDKILAGVFNTEVIVNPESPPEKKVEALDHQVSNLGGASTFSQFDNNMFLVRTKVDSRLAASFAGLQVNQAAANLIDARVLLELNPDITFTDGAYSLPAQDPLDVRQAGGVRQAKQGQIDKLNRFLSISTKYTDAGIIDWKGADAFHQDVLGEKQVVIETVEPRRRRFNVDTGQLEDVK